MRIVVLQPGYLPWLGFFDQMARCDTFVYYDDVLFDKNGWRNRNRVKTQGGPTWLTVPVLLSQHASQPRIRDVRIDNGTRWARKHVETVRQSYARAAFYKTYFEALRELLERPWEWLIELDLAVVELLRGAMGLHTPLRMASELDAGGERVERLVEICTRLGADEYLTGNAASDYLDASLFEQAGIRLLYQDYEHPVYSQLHGEFVPYLSALDLLLNCGPESLAVLRKTE